jgi:FkbM family methyltransferase
MLPVPVERRSAWRTLRWFVLRHVLRQRLLTARVEPLGLQVRAYSRDLVGRHLYKRGAYEPALGEFVLRHLQLPDDAVILDVGANLGWYSLLLGRRFPRARIHAFEPEPRNLALLRENVARNGLANVTVHGAAVAERVGTVQLYPYPEKNMGRHSVLPIHDAAPVAVPAVALDGFLAEQGIPPLRVGFVKIDIEGYEAVALRGARELLRAGPVWLCEFAPKYMRRGGLDPAEVPRLMRAHGYEPFLFRGGALQRCPGELLEGEARLDVIWRRPEPAEAR